MPVYRDPPKARRGASRRCHMCIQTGDALSVRRVGSPTGRRQRRSFRVTTVVQHVLNRLRDIGVKHVFGVPGDYAFPVNDAIAEHPDVEWVGNCNELNAAYCADGYARVHGVGAVCTTYGVGELSAICGIAGAYTEHVPLFRVSSECHRWRCRLTTLSYTTPWRW